MSFLNSFLKLSFMILFISLSRNCLNTFSLINLFNDYLHFLFQMFIFILEDVYLNKLNFLLYLIIRPFTTHAVSQLLAYLHIWLYYLIVSYFSINHSLKDFLTFFRISVSSLTITSNLSKMVIYRISNYLCRLIIIDCCEIHLNFI